MDISAVPQALLRPDRAFAERSVYRVPKPLLVLVLFLLYVIGQRLVVGYDQNAQAKELALREADARMSGFMANAPPEQQARAREQIVGSILGERSGVITAVGIVFQGLFFLLLFLEMWLVCTIITQFFGGQEDRHGFDRPSVTLFLVGFFPLAFRKLLEGIVLSFKNPEAAANALTLSEYRTVSAVRFDLFSLLPVHGVPDLPASLARVVTDPFFLWAFVVVTLGGRAVFRLSMKSAVTQSLILVMILGLQSMLLSRIGLTMEI
jgi:hypothetical protein